jgi:hypothetical protein
MQLFFKLYLKSTAEYLRPKDSLSDASNRNILNRIRQAIHLRILKGGGWLDSLLHTFFVVVVVVVVANFSVMTDVTLPMFSI